jgi:hypothetical protein
LRRLVRNAVVTLLVLFALISIYSAARELWTPRGTIALDSDYGAVVRSVIPGGAAARAGIRAGDRIDLAATPFEDRRFVAGLNAAVPLGSVVHVRFVREGVARDVALVSEAETYTESDRFTLFLQCVASFVFVVVGATLIVLRPSRATWGFGLYCLLALPTANDPFRFLPAAADFSFLMVYDIVQNVGVVGLVVFALEFPRPFAIPWRERVRKSLPAVFLVLALMTMYPDIANILYAAPAGVENRLLQLAFGATFALAIFIIFDSYTRIAHEERERLRWVIAGFVLGLATNFLGTTLLFSSLIPIAPPLWVTNVLVSLNVLLPLTVAHAVVRHRVLDIDFVIGRALVYAVLTTMLAGVFGLLDWLFGSTLEELRLSRFAEAAIAISIAFAFDFLHARTERVVEAVFFRKRRAAEARLARLARDLPDARTFSLIERALVGEVVDAFGLTSAALYRRLEENAGSAFVRTASHGWSDAQNASLDDEDLLVLALRSRKRPVDLAELPWRRDDVPKRAHAPLVGIPINSRSQLAGLVLYGGHPDGSDVDPSEVVQLERLVGAASVALDALDAERLRADIDAKASRVDELEARLDELRHARAAETLTSPERARPVEGIL